jgi:hypothetical protein
MTLLECFTKFPSIWKITIFILLFCIWPLTAFLIFHYNVKLFLQLDMFKLSLLTSAITSPFLVINSGCTFLILYPGNPELRIERENLQVIPGTAFLAVTFTAILMSIGSLLAFLNLNVNFVIISLAAIEGTFVLMCIYAAIKERT